jgi:hypothetical protein
MSTARCRLVKKPFSWAANSARFCGPGNILTRKRASSARAKTVEVRRLNVATSAAAAAPPKPVIVVLLGIRPQPPSRHPSLFYAMRLGSSSRDPGAEAPVLSIARNMRGDLARRGDQRPTNPLAPESAAQSFLARWQSTTASSGHGGRDHVAGQDLACRQCRAQEAFPGKVARSAGVAFRGGMSRPRPGELTSDLR